MKNISNCKDENQNIIVGYTSGVFDLFHIGHWNILKRAKEQCDYLIVGIFTDQLVAQQKMERVVCCEERMRIVEAIQFADKVVTQIDIDRMEIWEKYRFHKMFVGSNRKGSTLWDHYEKEFAEVGVDIVYLPYTQETTSTKLRSALKMMNNGYENLE